MGFERNTADYRCGCFSQKISHDSFNYTDGGEYRNVCGNHPSEESAREEHDRLTKVVEVVEKARNELVPKMNTDRIAHHLAVRKVISKDQKNDLLNLNSKFLKAQELIKMIFESRNVSLHHLRMAFVKAGQPQLLKSISEVKNKDNDEEDVDLQTSTEERCMIELQGDTFVVAKDYKGQIFINIRNYQTINGKKYATKQGVSLTPSGWLVLKSQKDFIDNVFKLCLSGEQVDEELIHLGGGVYVTLNSQYPTVDIRHFWKPEDSDKPVATKRGIALNNIKWQKLCDTMTVMTDFVPELKSAVICEYTHFNDMGMVSCSECDPFNMIEEKGGENISQNQEGDFQIMKSILVSDSESDGN